MSGPKDPQKVQIYFKANPDDAWGQHPIVAQYNPESFTLEKQRETPSSSGSGQDLPHRQNPRSDSDGEKLTVDLFFDTTSDGMGTGATPVTSKTDDVYALVKPRPAEHGPPICFFTFGTDFPGAYVRESVPGQQRYGFVCIVQSVRQVFSLFSIEGVPLRATLSLSLVEYKRPSDQAAQQNHHSPDRTQAHVLQRRDALWRIASRYYRQPDAWRAIATDNALDDPRRLVPGQVLTIPPIR